MKKIKTCIIALIITNLIFISTAFVISARAEANPVTSEDYYSKLVVITNSSRLTISIWIIECRDRTGNYWKFRNEGGDLQKGDILTLLMFRLNDNEEDDEYMEYTYEGHTDNIDLFFQVMGWR